MSNEEKGELFCICADAKKEVCAVCPKYKAIKPTHIAICSTWKRDLTNFK